MITTRRSSRWRFSVFAMEERLKRLGHPPRGDGSGGARAIFIYDGTRNPLPMQDVYIHDNVLNGDRIQSCTSTGVTCD